MPGRTYAASSSPYRYGFNGKEKDNEVKGEGNELDFGERIYDPRVGRFLSIDPLTANYPYQSPYVYAGDNPILFIDVDGEGPDKPLDPSLEGRLKIALPSYADVLIRCNNASLRAFESYAWTTRGKGDVRNNKFNGLAGEAVVVDYLRTLSVPFARQLRAPYVYDKNGTPETEPQYWPASHVNKTFTIGGWNDDKSIDIVYSLNLGDKGSYKLGINRACCLTSECNNGLHLVE